MQKYQKLFILTIALIGAWFLFGHAQAAEAISWTVKTGTTGEANAYMAYAQTCTASPATTPNNRITLNLNFTDLPYSGGGYWIDFKRTYDYNTSQDDWIWNTHLAGGVQTFVTDGSNLVDSPWDAGGVNLTPKELFGGWNYYVRVYNPDTGVHTLYPGALGTMICANGQAVPDQPTISATPSCAGAAGYTTGTISWGGMYDNRAGFWVDISDVSDFSRWWNKSVGNTATTSFSGFTGYAPSGVSGPLPTLTAGATYYVRVFNGGHSTVRSFSVPECARPACVAGTISPIGATISDTATTHTITLNTTNATAVNISIYNQAAGLGSNVWWPATASGGGSYTLTFDPRTYGSYGTFIVSIYMNNANWTDQGCVTHPDYTRVAPQPPSCSLGVNSATPDGFVTYETSGTHTVTLSGVSVNTAYIWVAIWSDSGGTDDQWFYYSDSGVTRVVSQGGGVWTLTFNLASHPGLGNVNVHAYVNNAVTTNVGCDNANFSRQLRPATSKPVISNTPTTTISGLGVTNTSAPCKNNSYSVTLSWTGMGSPNIPTLSPGYYVDASTVSNFASYWNKNIALPNPNTTSTNASTTAGTGFVPYTGVSGGLNLQPNRTYYFRVYNDQHSPTSDPLFIPRCGSLRVEPNNEAGAWTITKAAVAGSPAWSTSGTGTKQFNNNIPVGTYSLTPTANTPAGYNGTVTPATLVVP